MNLIVVADIFGRTTALESFAEHFSDSYRDTIILDPYAGQNYQFENEADAYRYFQQQSGLDKLIELLETQVRQTDAPLDIISFSVGASAAWEISALPIADKIRTNVCFYGSRIREKTAISPKCSTRLIFPATEETFELEPVIQKVEKKSNVEIIRTSYLHGFMNRESKNFSISGYREFCAWLTKRLNQINQKRAL